MPSLNLIILGDIMKILGMKNIEYFDAVYQKDFFYKCIQKKDYIENIRFKVPIEGTYVICFENKNIGIFYPNIEVSNGIKIAKTVIYIEKKYSLESGFAFMSTFIYLFFMENINYLMITVYKRNKKMINLLDNWKVKFNGELKLCKENDLNNLMFYSIRDSDARMYKEVFKEAYEYNRV